MPELSGSGAITDEYLAEAEALKPILNKRGLSARERQKQQDAVLKELSQSQKVKS